MFIIELIFIFLSASVFLQVSTKPSTGYVFILGIAAILMACAAGLRFSSPDYENYYLYFDLLSRGNDYRQINIVAPDPAFAYLNIGLSKIYDSPIILFCFFGIASVFLNAYCYQKYVRYFLISMLFYLVHTYVARELMQIRAGLACALCLYSLRYIVNQQFWKFLSVIALASSFHLGASTFLLAYSLGKLNISSRVIIITLIVSFITAIAFPLGAFFKTLPNYTFLERVQYYNESEYGGANGLFNNVVIIKELMIVLVCLFYRNLLGKIPYFKVSFNLYLFSLIWLILWNDFSIVAARIATFFSITEVLLMAMIPFIANEGLSRKLLTGIIVLIAGVIMMMNIYTGKWEDIVIL